MNMTSAFVPGNRDEGVQVFISYLWKEIKKEGDRQWGFIKIHTLPLGYLPISYLLFGELL